MRAVYLPLPEKILENLPENLDEQEVIVEGQQAHHLANVIRVQVGEVLLILDGAGGAHKAIVREVRKREVKVGIQEVKRSLRPLHFDLGICVPKKDAMDEVIKLAVELGVRRLVPIRSTFSVQGFQESNERNGRLIESAMIQSNNPFYLEIKKESELKNISLDEYHHVFYFCSNLNLKELIKENGKRKDWQIPRFHEKNYLLLIGPEGGLSAEEESRLKEIPQLSFIHFPSPILRTPHAVGVAAGHFFSLMENSIEANGEL